MCSAANILSAWNDGWLFQAFFWKFFCVRHLSLWNDIDTVLSYWCNCYYVRFVRKTLIMPDLGRAAWTDYSQCTRCYVCTLGRLWGCFTHCEPIFMEWLPFAQKVALSHGSASKITWLHNNRVYRMADEWVDYCPLSSYVLRNGFGERGNYTLFWKMNNETGL